MQHTLTYYKISTTGFHVYLCFKGGLLWQSHYELRHLQQPIWTAFHKELPQSEGDLKRFTGFFAMGSHWKVTVKSLVDGRHTQEDKLRMFCAAFKHYRKVAYVPKDVEKANLKAVQVTPDYLRVFFETPGLSNYSITNYITRYNITRDYATNGMPDQRQATHPGEWSRDYDRTLTDEERMVYWRHLVTLGWVKKHGPNGTYFVDTSKEKD